MTVELIFMALISIKLRGKASAMAKKTPERSVKDRIVDAMLALASEEPWTEINFQQISLAAQVDHAEALEYFDDKSDILVAYGRRIDARLFAEVHNIISDDMSEREKIFDLIMERFDLINEDRNAILSVMESIKHDPKQAVLTFPHLAKSMTRILEAACVETAGVRGAAQVTGLVGVYLYVVKTWKEDDSADMAKTMATLDKALDYAEMTANSFLNGNILSGARDLFGRFKEDKAAS